MGLSHGGLRQKMFNVYEETINVPLVFSNPALFSDAAETDALASLVDLVPTLLTLGGGRPNGDLRGRDLAPVMAATAKPDTELTQRAAVRLSPVLEHRAPAGSVQDAIHFTYDDHQAATAMQNAPGQPNRIRAIRTRDSKYAFYFDPEGRAQTEHELYDLERDPLEVENLLGVRTGEPRSAAARQLRAELSERLDEAMTGSHTAPPEGFGISGTP
jgi:choline-sulfatase